MLHTSAIQEIVVKHLCRMCLTQQTLTASHMPHTHAPYTCPIHMPHTHAPYTCPRHMPHTYAPYNTCPIHMPVQVSVHMSHAHADAHVLHTTKVNGLSQIMDVDECLTAADVLELAYRNKDNGMDLPHVLDSAFRSTNPGMPVHMSDHMFVHMIVRISLSYV